ncbi:hypothetical protein GLOIN_2v347829 [Rhizophagus irregularis DAOM 181602=DAOM 197198]|uniref:Uncharacterized protein n=1 Tax=Rhizophagus irregularis (strain DAOM 181602 / DAOM 197198 / MUCL 43194) TaxID=747089 RepID=A0A2P4PMB8_RHIID|nr:hypothetical protein GLOIN_2v347829 [Rhizophagus irregularis DAOM 181602=DAOM 197198]POG66536.1 hypothetical protein GLOIN_2v347829 [Rhizophagus irregularis DAOM 181602=DAOM 197198]GET56854.1 hypothetical protein GLOIN_2v347829 [Rhizophagus irregularis DAOM 181602=DAOM 197198]|eukprot:XP_025173402.1 hypothetical protein GLOIN_2v347829 [Rhizophagus irregularis DAOM 181602=DAOM 197198]
MILWGFTINHKSTIHNMQAALFTIKFMKKSATKNLCVVLHRITPIFTAYSILSNVTWCTIMFTIIFIFHEILMLFVLFVRIR